MLRDELATHDDVRARRTDVAGRASIFAVAAEKLSLDRDGKFLVFPHGGRVLAVEHGPAIANRPAGAALALIAHESIFETQDVVGEFLFVEEMSKLGLEGVVLVVLHFQQTVLTRKVSL